MIDFAILFVCGQVCVIFIVFFHHKNEKPQLYQMGETKDIIFILSVEQTTESNTIGQVIKSNPFLVLR
jgi:hypothetical protein